MRLLVTGASGFLGGHLCEALSGKHEIVAMVRKGSDTSLLTPLGVELRCCDLADPSSLIGVARNVDAVVHLAAYYTFTGDEESYRRINVEGTRALLASMINSGVARIVYCSSTEALGPTGAEPANEDRTPAPVYAYGRSKVQGEELVREHASRGIDHTIIRPSGIYGPRNFEDISYWFITAFGGSVMGRFVVGDGRRLLQFVHVDDVVQGFRLALENPRSIGRTYHISDSRAYTYDEIYAMLAAIFGRRPPRRHVPVPVAKALVAPVEGLNRLMGRDSFMFRSSTMETFREDRNYSIERASMELGYSPRWSLPEGLEATVRWYRENGYL